MRGASSTHREKNAYEIFIGTPEGMQTRRTRENTIKTGLLGTGCENVDWFHVAQNRNQWRALVNAVMNSLVA
jgi:hypothetical protein